MSNSGRNSNAELEQNVILDMRENRIEEPASMEDIIQVTDIDDRDEAKDVLRRLINDGKLSTTPDWEYKLASRLRR
jgi:predicted MarR family transcription regulator